MLGSHNSLSFSGPKHFLAWLIAPIWRSQTLDIRQQVAAGVRCFDIRCAWDGQRFVGAHGAVKFQTTIYSALGDIEFYCPGAYIRILLEQGENNPEICNRFHKACEEYQSLYPRLTFFCGRTKYGWKKAADLSDGPEVVQHVGSMKSRWGAILPGVWARIHRKDIPELPSEDVVLLLDIIHSRYAKL